MLTKTEASSRIARIKMQAFEKSRELVKGTIKPPKGVSVGDALFDITMEASQEVDCVLLEYMNSEKLRH